MEAASGVIALNMHPLSAVCIHRKYAIYHRLVNSLKKTIPTLYTSRFFRCEMKWLSFVEHEKQTDTNSALTNFCNINQKQA